MIVRSVMSYITIMCSTIFYDIDIPKFTLKAIYARSSRYKLIISPANQLTETYSKSPSATVFVISDIGFPADISVPHTSAAPNSIVNPDKSEVEWFLNYLFRKTFPTEPFLLQISYLIH